MWQLADHSFYDNADDNRASNHANNTAYGLLNGLFTTSAGSWQCGRHGIDSLRSTHFHRRLSVTVPVDDASAMRPLSDLGEPAVGLHLHGAHLVRSRRIRHFMPTTGGPAPQNPHETADRQHPGGDRLRPHRYMSQPPAPLNSDHPLPRVPKSGQLVHGIGMPTIGWAKTRYTGSNASDGPFDHAPAKTTRPSRCATPTNPRPRT